MFYTGEYFEVTVIRLEKNPEEIRLLRKLLSDTELRRAERFTFDRDRNRYIVARARLRELLATRLNVRPEAIELTYGVHGKPVLARRFEDTDLRFNLSHSDDVAVYAFSLGREIGIDVEAIRAIPDADDIAAKFFSRRENEAYLDLDPSDKPLGFFNCWTRKEAFIKAIGEGLYYPLDSFDVSFSPGEPAKILRIKDMPGSECGWCMDSFSPAPGFVAAVVIENPKYQRSTMRLSTPQSALVAEAL